MRTAFALLAPIALASCVHAGVQTKTIEYTHGTTKLEGFLAWDDSVATEKTPRPGVLVCPEWWGNNQYARDRARRLAALGYVALSIDMYGKDESGKLKVTEDPKQAGQWSGEVGKDPALRRDRAKAGYKVLTDQKIVDTSRTAAIGYCMGGTVALELARTGADLKAIVPFHASRISADAPEDNKNIKGSVLVCHGQDDGFVPAGEIEKFHAQMKEAGVDYQFVSFSGAVHSFTNTNADSFKIPGVAYNAHADHRSWEHMTALLAEVFGEKKDGAKPAAGTTPER